MSERMKILDRLKKQIQKPPLRCNPGPHCWCAQIDFVFDEPQSDDTCMTPQQILDTAGNELSIRDQRYLETLLGRELVQQ